MTEKLRLRLQRGLSEAWWPGDASRTQEGGFEFGRTAVSAPVVEPGSERKSTIRALLLIGRVSMLLASPFFPLGYSHP